MLSFDMVSFFMLSLDIVSFFMPSSLPILSWAKAAGANARLSETSGGRESERDAGADGHDGSSLRKLVIESD